MVKRNAPEKHAIAVDPETRSANLNRLKRIEGQVRGLQKMVEDDRYCPDILVQLSAVQEALRQVGRALLSNHLRHCVTHAVAHDSDEKIAAMYDELTELIYKHAR